MNIFGALTVRRLPRGAFSLQEVLCQPIVNVFPVRPLRDPASSEVTTEKE